MVMPAAGAFLANQVLPRLGQSAMNMGGEFLNNQFSARQGQTNIGGVDPSTAGFIRNNNLQVNSGDQMRLSTEDARRQLEDASRIGRGDTLFSAAVGEQQYNNALQRSALLDAQANAANLAQNAVNAAASRAASNNQLIGNALGAGLARSAGRL